MRFERLALLVSSAPHAQEAVGLLRDCHDWCKPEEADAVVVLGGDGTMLEAMHQMLRAERAVPVYGLNLGTVGFLMNRYSPDCDILERLEQARAIAVSPLRMNATTQDGKSAVLHAFNEVSLLRETRQTAKIEITVNEKVRIPELACDGVLLSTPFGSTAYNLSANGPILPLDSQMLALTPISPFRPRRWRGAILPDRSRVSFRVLEPEKRPVAAVADQMELRNIAEVHLQIDHEQDMTLLFDPGHALDERIVAEQFAI